MEALVLQMRMPKTVIELISLNYKSMTVVEFNRLFELRGFKKYREVTIQKKINALIEKDEILEKNRMRREAIALSNPIKYRASTLLSGARSRAKAKGIDCNLTLAWIEKRLQDGICECTGIDFHIREYSKKDVYIPIHPHSPSLDQIEPSGGYTMDNVQIVCDQFNKMKNDRSMEQTFYVAKKFVETYSKNIIKNLEFAVVS
jgi:hypothetical protein